ncbi:Similar to Stress-induced-phosphoprotein 1; acc. no. Q3ZBZ8 [Pyronema omphalodes CBS 100304]|uniref:Similar to Stress-induced-phosphoprotein 1 acc. no. Q3ZBZ8 n=1 Tax=Pyronema omphalodes (strain CBS 100304) TaxID=1076935 RepID=U4KX85_PYROM|nr:Similar to Stress-induced-phosphoprotein 1; acc. no. Q3ZBZ8 [Pyronema omphalodes CBS 100304]
MAPQRPEPTEAQLQQSDEWKQKGNVAFRAKNYTEAFDYYTEAIALNPSSATLYSNRSAALLALKRLPLALNDAKICVKMDKTWAKGFRRKASVLDAMKRFQDAFHVYGQALNAIKKDDTLTKEQKKAEHAEIIKLQKVLAEKMTAKNNSQHPDQLLIRRDEAYSPGLVVLREAERRVDETGELMGTWPPIGSCRRRLWIAEMQYHNAILHLMEYSIKEQYLPTVGLQPYIIGRLQTLEELTTALTEDIRVGRLGPPSLEKLKLCFTMEQQRRNAIGPGMSPQATIAEYARRLTESPDQRAPTPFDALGGSTRAIGWDYVRPALQLTIRSSLMNGFLKRVFGEGEIGSVEFRRCVELIEAAQKEWSDVDGSIRGRTLEETFLRQVKVHLGESLVIKYLRELKTNPNMPVEEKKKFLDEIISIGEWIVMSHENESSPPEKDKFAHPAGEAHWWTVYYTHYTAPLAKAYNFIGFGNLRYGIDVDTISLVPDSTETGKRGPIASSPSRLGIAAMNYAKAAAWMPADDPECANSLWLAIHAMVTRGGYYLADFEVLRDMANNCVAHYTPHFRADIIPENHCGKCEAESVEGTITGQTPESVCSAVLRWDENDDQSITAQVQDAMHDLMHETLMGTDGGFLMITEAIWGVWRDRETIWGEPEEYVNLSKVIWKELDKEVRENWKFVLEYNQKGGGKVFVLKK